MTRSNEIDLRSTDTKFVYGLATIREAFRGHPQHESYIESLTLKIIESYGRIRAAENELAQAA